MNSNTYDLPWSRSCSQVWTIGKSHTIVTTQFRSENWLLGSWTLNLYRKILGKWSFGPKDHEKFNVRSSMMTVLKSNCEDRNIKYDLEIRKRSWSKMQLCKSDLENHIRSRISNTILEIKYDLEVKYDLLKYDLEANYDLAKYDLENQIRSVFWRSETSNTIMTA